MAWARLGEVAVVEDDEAAIALSDRYAPEHLEVMTRTERLLPRQAQELRQPLPRRGKHGRLRRQGRRHQSHAADRAAARYTGGLWVGKFLKTVTYQRLTPEASERIAPIIGRMCATEGMLAHEITANVRVERYAQRRRDGTAADRDQKRQQGRKQRSARQGHNDD